MIDTVRRGARQAVGATGRLYDAAIDRVLASHYEIPDAATARRVLDEPGGVDVSAVADQIQQLAVVAMPIVRRVAKANKIPGLKKVPVVLSLVTVGNVVRAIRQGVREVQVVASYLAARVAALTGAPPDPALVKRLAVQLYLHPSRPVATTGGRPDMAGLLRRWLLHGLFGRTSSAAAHRAIDAIQRLDLSSVIATLEAGTVAERTIAPALKAGAS
jgi:hypothetical protein